MKKLFLALISLLIASIAFSQDTIFFEGFEGVTNTTYTSNSSSIAGIANFSYEIGNNGRLRFSMGSAFCHTGNRAATLDKSHGIAYATNHLIKTIDLSNYTDSNNYKLSFWFMSHGDYIQNNDNISIRSSNASNWIKVYQVITSNVQSGKWYKCELDLDSLVRLHNLNPTSSFQIRFSQYDLYSTVSTTHNAGITYDDLLLSKEHKNNINIKCLQIIAPNVWENDSNYLTIQFKNTGFDTINYFSAGYKIDTFPEVIIDSINKGSLYQDGIETYSFPNPLSLSKSKQTIKIWVNKPNAIFPDSNSNDDTLIITAYKSLSGTFYVDSTGNGDFTTIIKAVDSFKKCGINDHVKIIIKNGYYNERITIPNILGTNRNARISFVGESKNGVILNYNATSNSNRSTIILSNAQFITIKNLTINNSGHQRSTCIFLTNSSNHIIIDSCTLKTQTNLQYGNGTVINASGSELLKNKAGGNFKNVTISNCLIYGGDEGIYMTGLQQDSNTYLKIINTRFEKQDFNSIWITHCKNSNLVNNTIKDQNSTGGFGIRMDTTSCDTIAGNIINPGNTGIYLVLNNFNNSISNERTLIANNMVCNFKSSTWNLGIAAFHRCNNVDILHNTVLSKGTSITKLANVALLAYMCNRTKIKNNILIAENSSFAINIDQTWAADIDYNAYVYPKNSSKKHFSFGSEFNTFEDFKNSDSYGLLDLNSYDNRNPYLISDTNLYLDLTKTNQLLGDSAGILNDIDSNLRFSNLPTIGADEYDIKGLNISLARIDSPRYFRKASNLITVSYQNRGLDTIKYVSLGYQFNNDTIHTVDSVLTNNMVLGETKKFNFTRPLVINIDTGILRVWVNKPNGATHDSIRNDDTLSVNIRTALIDTYYIDKNGNGDYISFQSAVYDLHTYGVSGPVVFIVKKGSYNEQVLIKSIDGSSEVNTISFIGEQKDSVDLYFNSYFVGNKATLKFNGAKNIVFDNIVLESKNTVDGIAIKYENCCSNINIQNCNIISANGASSQGICVQGSINCSNSFLKSEYSICFKNNYFFGGDYGIKWEGVNSDTNSNLLISGNIFDKQFIAAIYNNRLRGTKIIGNEIKNMNYDEGKGIYCTSTSLDTIVGNIIFPGYIGIELKSHNQSLITNRNYKSLISNNMICNFLNTYKNIGIYLNYHTYNTNVFHNSVLVKGTATTSYINSALYANDRPKFSSIRNNIFKAENKGYAINLKDPYDLDIDYNLYVYPPNSTSNHLKINTGYKRFQDYKNNSTIIIHDQNSYDNIDPNFLSDSNLHINFSMPLAITGDSIGILYDIDSNHRIIESPFLGADEFEYKKLNIALIRIDSPKVWDKGQTNLVVSYQNRGNDTIFHASFGYKLNNDSIILQDSIVLDTLKFGEIKQFTFSNRLDLVGGQNTLKVWVNKPNGATIDSFPSDDTISVVEYAGLKDTLVIDSSGNGDFTTFNQAIDSLKLVGVNSKVIFLVKPGTYIERLVIPEIRGANNENRINFIGVHKDSVILSYQGNSSNKATIVMNGADYFTFKRLTIENTGSNYGIGVFYTNNSNKNVVDSCRIIVEENGAKINLIGICAANSESSLNSIGYTGYNNIIQNSEIFGGYAGIKWVGASQDSNHYIHIKANLIRYQYAYSIWLMNIRGTCIQKNIIDSNQYSYGTGIYCYYTSLDTITKNIMKPFATGINFYRPNSSFSINSSLKSLIANNIISNFSNQSDQVGIHFDSEMRCFNILHNTISISATNSNKGNSSFYSSSCTNSDIKNNIFIAENNAFVFSSSNFSNFVCDNNCYIYPNTGNHFYKGRYYTDFESFTNDPYKVLTDLKSYDNENPYFFSSTNLHLDTSKTRVLIGDSLGITEDIDGDLRSLTQPTIGADENVFKGIDIGICKVDSPIFWKRGDNNLAVTFQNRGLDTIKYISLGYKYDTTTVKIDSVRINHLATGDLGKYTFNAPLRLTMGQNLIKIWINKPNGVLTDRNPYNDTLTLDVYAFYNSILKDTLTIDSSGNGDFTTFSQALQALDSNGFTGNLVFLVRKGTYNEQIRLDDIPGTNDSNTITFSGTNRDSIIISFHGNTSAQDRTTIFLNGADYITFDNLTIRNTNTTYGACFIIRKSAKNVAIKNCILDLPVTTSNYVIGINCSDQQSNFNLKGENFLNLEILNNLFIGGNSAIYITGNGSEFPLGCKIEGNEMTGQRGNAINVYLHRGTRIYSNYIHDLHSSSPRGISLIQTDFDSIVANKIYPGYAGIVFERHNTNFNYNTTNKSLVSNNLITNHSSNIVNIGIQTLYFCSNIEILHNSILTQGTSTSYSSNVGLYIYNNNKHFTVKNNIFWTKNNSYFLYLNSPDSNIFNYNDYIFNNNPGSPKFYFVNNSLNYISYISSISPYGSEINSYINIDPFFSDTINLTLDTTRYNGLFGDYVGISKDIDGESRCTLSPMLGADEFNPGQKVYNFNDSIIFEKVYPNKTFTKKVFLKNRSCVDSVKILGLSTIDSFFNGYTIKSSFAPIEQIPVYIDFNTFQKGSYHDTLTIFTEDDTFSLSLKANCILPPKINLSNNSFSSNIVCEDTIFHFLYIKNTGEDTLIIEIDSSISQIIKNQPINQSLAKNDSIIYQIIIVPFSHKNGNYYSDFIIKSNDSTRVFDTIYINTNINRIPNLYIETPIIDLDSISQYDTICRYIVMENLGCDTLFVNNVFNDLSQYRISDIPGFIPPYSTDSFLFCFNDFRPATYFDTISVHTNDTLKKLFLACKVFPTPNLVIDEDSLTSSFTICNDSITQQFYIQNIGSARIIIDSIYNDNSLALNYLEYNIEEDTIQGSDSALMTIKFKNVGYYRGIYNSTIFIHSNSYFDTVHTINCIMNSNTSPKITIYDDSINFDSVFAGEVDSKSFWIYNTSCDTLNISNFNNNLSQFNIQISKTVIDRYDSSLVSISFMPDQIQPFVDTLTIFNNDTTKFIYLFGIGKLGSEMDISSSNLSFVFHLCNDSNSFLTYIKNTGHSDLIIKNISDDLNSSIPKWLSYNLSKDTIAFADSALLSIALKNNGLYNGIYQSTITIITNDYFDSIHTIFCQLNSNTKPDYVLDKSKIDFDTLLIGKSNTDTVLLNNISCDSVKIFSINNNLSSINYTLQNNNIDRYDSSILQISFTPLQSGKYIDTVWIQSNDSLKYITISGVGAVGSKIQTNVNSFYSSLVACDTSEFHNLKIFNPGDMLLEFALDTTNIPYWLKLNKFRGKIVPGDSVSILVEINPKNHTFGNYNYSLKINSNDSANQNLKFDFQLNVAKGISGIIKLGNDTTYCPDNKLTLNAGSGFASYLWQDSSTNQTINVLDSGQYHIIASDNKGCKYFDTIHIGFYPAPVANFTINDTAQCLSGNNFVFTNSSSILNGQITSKIWTLDNTDYPGKDTLNHTFSNSGKYVVKLLVSSQNQCADSIEKQVEVFNQPNISLGADTTLCPGRSMTFKVDSVFKTYLWQNADTTPSITIRNTLSSNQTVSLNVIDSNNCTTSDTVMVYHNNDCVYPGDANADGVVDNQDVLYIGIKFNSTGCGRPDASILWRAEHSTNWNDTIQGGTDIKHVDTDGDGIINNSDTLAIQTNYGKLRGSSESGRASDPPLFIDLPDTLRTGQLISAPIMLGTSDKQINDIYGVAFEIADENNLIKNNKIELDFSNSWMGNSGSDLLTFSHLYDVSLVRTDQTNISGFGKIGELKFTVIDSLKGSSSSYFTIKNILALDVNENKQPIYSQKDTFVVTSGFEEKISSSGFIFRIYPNPAKNNVIVEVENIKSQSATLQFINMQGKVVLNDILQPSQIKILKEFDISKLAKGVYLVKVISGDDVVVEKFVKE